MAQFKESAELVAGVGVVVRACLAQFKDGFQATDLPVLVAKLSTDPTVLAAVKGATLAKQEFAQMDQDKVVAAIQELTPVITDVIVGIIVELKK